MLQISQFRLVSLYYYSFDFALIPSRFVFLLVFECCDRLVAVVFSIIFKSFVRIFVAHRKVNDLEHSKVFFLCRGGRNTRMTLFRRREAPVETAPSGPTFFPGLPQSAESNGISRCLRSKFSPPAENSGFRRGLSSEFSPPAEPSGFRRSLHPDLPQPAEPSGFRHSLRSDCAPPAEPSGFSRGLYPGVSHPDDNSGLGSGFQAGLSAENSGLGRGHHSRLPPPDENSGFNRGLNALVPPAAYNECPVGGPFPSLRPPNDSSIRFSRGFHPGLPLLTEQSGFARGPLPRLPLSSGMPPSAGRSSLPPENSGLSCSLPPGAFPNLDGQPGVWVIDPAAEVMTWGGVVTFSGRVGFGQWWGKFWIVWGTIQTGHKFWRIVGISIVVSFSVADPGCLSRIPDPTFFHPGSRIRTVFIPDPGSSSKNLSILTPKKAKKWFLSSKKYDPDPDADFLPSRIQGSKRHPIPDPDPQHLFLYDMYLTLAKYHSE